MSDSDGLDRGAIDQPSPSEPDRSTTNDALDERLAAVERAVTDEGTVADLSTTAERDQHLADLTKRVEEIEARLDELDAATQALRGYVGSIRAVNEEVEQRADLALAIAERTERNTGGRTVDEDDRSEVPESRPTGADSRSSAEPTDAVVGAGDAAVADAVRDSSTESAESAVSAESAGDHPVPAAAAAVPDEGSDPDDGLLARLQDVL